MVASARNTREELPAQNLRPSIATHYAHGIYTVCGEILSNIVQSLLYGVSVAVCGRVASPNFTTTVLPFILRGVNILGIDSVELPIASKNKIWPRLAADWKILSLDAMTVEIGLEGISEAVDAIFAGQVSGRTLVVH